MLNAYVVYVGGFFKFYISIGSRLLEKPMRVKEPLIPVISIPLKNPRVS